MYSSISRTPRPTLWVSPGGLPMVATESEFGYFLLSWVFLGASFHLGCPSGSTGRAAFSWGFFTHLRKTGHNCDVFLVSWPRTCSSKCVFFLVVCPKRLGNKLGKSPQIHSYCFFMASSSKVFGWLCDTWIFWQDRRFIIYNNNKSPRCVWL